MAVRWLNPPPTCSRGGCKMSCASTESVCWRHWWRERKERAESEIRSARSHIAWYFRDALQYTREVAYHPRQYDPRDDSADGDWLGGPCPIDEEHPDIEECIVAVRDWDRWQRVEYQAIRVLRRLERVMPMLTYREHEGAR